MTEQDGIAHAARMNSRKPPRKPDKDARKRQMLVSALRQQRRDEP